MDHRTAVERLRGTRTRCEAAKALVDLGDPRALLDLVIAYEMGRETSALCLLDAMEALGGARAADALFDQAGPEDRRRIVHLMELFPDDKNLPRLLASLQDAEERVRVQARRALATQRQTPAWEKLMINLLKAVEPVDSLLAVECLAGRKSDLVRLALNESLRVESRPQVLVALQNALKISPDTEPTGS
jgi:hypothetical protein